MSIRRYEQGERIIPDDVLQHIAAALDVETVELIPEDKKSEFVEYLLEQIAKGEDVSDLKFTPEKARLTPADNRRARMLTIYDRVLNDDGQKKAADAVDVIAGNPDYQRKRPQEGCRATSARSEGQDTIPPSDTPETSPEGK